MSTIAETAPQTGSRGRHLRALLAGGTATTALIAGAAVVFLSLAAYVAFQALPDDGGSQANEGAVTATSPGAPEAAAAALRRAPAAVAARPAASTPTAPAPGTPSAAAPTAAGGAIDADATADGSATPTPTPTPTAGAGQASDGGALSNTVTEVQDTTADLGVNLPLDPVQNATQPVDQTVDNTLNNVGGLLGDPQLGTQVDTTLDNTTDGVLGAGGVTDQILNGGN